jgi:hypothetical protein
MECAEVQVLSIEDPDHVWLRKVEDRTCFLDLDEEIQYYCRSGLLLRVPVPVLVVFLAALRIRIMNTTRIQKHGLK